MENPKANIIIEFIVILSMLSAAFLVDLEKSRFRGDESMWINQSSHFEDFLTGKFSKFTENTSKNLALTMPTIPEYVIGLSRRMGGYSTAQLNKIWEWNKTYEENIKNGNAPSSIEMIWWSRFLPTLLSIASVMITFYLIKISFNVRVGYFWLILTLVNPWLIYTLSGAMGEPPLLFNIVIAMLTGFWAIKSFRDDPKEMRNSLFWLTMFGVFTGLAGQSKMNGLAIFGSAIVILLIMSAYCSANWRWRFFLTGLAGISIAGFLCYVGTNPFLWDDPIGKTIQTYQYRIEIMHGPQAIAFPNIVIKDWQDGLQIALKRTFKDLASMRFTNSNYLNMLLTGLGSGVLIKMTRAAFTDKPFSPSHAGVLSILLIGLFASVPNLFTPLNIDRYYLLPVYFVSILIALGLDWFLKYISQAKLSNQKFHAEA